MDDSMIDQRKLERLCLDMLFLIQEVFNNTQYRLGIHFLKSAKEQVLIEELYGAIIG
jgi:hypothetical protein